MTGRGHYFQDKRDPLLEEISGEFLNGVLHGRGTCFKKILSPQNVTTGLVITVGYCWNRGTLHHGFEIIVDSNNNVQSIKQFKSNFKYSFDPHAGDIFFENDNDVPVSVTTNGGTNGNAPTTPTSGKVPLLSLSNIGNSSSGSLDAISPRVNNSLTPNSSRSPRTPRNHLIKPVGINEAKIEQIEFIEVGELNRVKNDLVEKQSGLLHAWKEKLNNVQEKIKNLTKQKANLESQLAEVTEELTYFRNKDTETEQRLEQYISQHKELFEEYELVTNKKIKTLESTIHEINQVKEMEIAKKNSEMEELRQSLHNKIENLDREWNQKYSDLEKVKTTQQPTAAVDESPTSLSPETNQISAIPKRRSSIMRHRRSFSSMDVPQMQTTSEGDDSSSTSIGSVSPASNTNIGTQVIGEEFDIESSPHATTTYKTLNSNTAINTNYETAQQRENKIIGRPRSNSQDNSSATSSIDIVRGTVNSAQLNIQERPPQPIIDIAATSSEKSTTENSSSENTTASSNGNSSNSTQESSQATEHSNDNENNSINSNESNQNMQFDISPRISTSETKHSIKSTSLENSPKSSQTSTWVSADILYQKIRENLKKTSSPSEKESSGKQISDSFDWRQVLKKNNNHK
ncbi:hypothetical protein NAEGRDRAFT_81347 [Naegleria gruberi]|uniref:Uncharacterized protein n=1 Tax=Naegleria gruberi TaxID=5762 RepID=D2VV90_NAEGR|nr:uncharacterized protein NAEGRDRAFT_81347 [Naegleria gruberi]EFC39193.1 hypothetical protein NAEGRDRAFT_81347 [Naegleria gruberi]|eukprot:XP_002671937.1 hypothetical protein NAEGRDRAFT_81347 [Naegleria gruberi strain NEG-M]